MQLIAWLIKIVIFIALLGFALGNTEVVHLGVFGKQEVGFDAPLVVFLLGFFALGMIVGLLALVALTGQQLAQGFVSLWSKALEGYNELVHWLDNMGYSLGAEQLNQLLEQGRKLASENPSSIVRGVSEVGSTAAEVAHWLPIVPL